MWGSNGFLRVVFVERFIHPKLVQDSDPPGQNKSSSYVGQRILAVNWGKNMGPRSMAMGPYMAMGQKPNRTPSEHPIQSNH